MRVSRRAVVAGGLLVTVPGILHALDVAVYVADGTTPTGPFDEAGLRERIKSRAEAAETMVWHAGMPDWAPATQVAALAGLVASLPAKTPVDFSTFILGKWRHAGAFIELEIEEENVPRQLPANVTWEFKADGKYSVFGKAEWTLIRPQVISRPPSGGDVAQRPIYRVVDDSIRITLKESGTFKVLPVGPESFGVEIKGKATVTTNDERPKKKDNDKRFLLRIIGPDQLRTDDGQEFYRLSQ